MKIIESLRVSKKVVIAAICGILVVSAVGVSTAGTAQAKEIGPEKAAAVALSNAGFKESEVKKLVSSYDKEDGQGVYEVDFYAGGNEYDYVVSAKDGKVIEVKKEKMDAEDYKEAGLEVPEALKPKAEAKKSSTSTGAAAKPAASKSSTSSQSSQYIGVSAAKKAALKHAGVSSSDAVFEKAKLEKDDGRYEYEVDFKAKGYEYDYEIDAKSGKILSADKEKDDDAVAKKPAQSTNSSSSNISKDAAKNAALKHAGVSASNAVFEKVELDKDDGKVKYEIEFRSGGVEYEYEIDAKSGKVLSAESEREDRD